MLHRPPTPAPLGGAEGGRGVGTARWHPAVWSRMGSWTAGQGEPRVGGKWGDTH